MNEYLYHFLRIRVEHSLSNLVKSSIQNTRLDSQLEKGNKVEAGDRTQLK